MVSLLIQFNPVESYMSDAIALIQVYNNCIIRFLEDPTDSLSLIRDADKLVAYRFYKNNADAPLVVFINQQMEE